MIYQFKSQSAGTVSMNQGIAETILKAIGKDPAAQGVITVEQMPQAITAVKSIASGEPDAAAVASHTDAFVQMLESSLKGKADVTWGV